MSIDRRDFLKLASLVGLSVAAPAIAIGGEPRILGAEPDRPLDYDGPFFVMINAGGGWDPTLLCDPKGANVLDEPDAVNRNYLTDDIQSAGKIDYAPVGYNDTFFQKYGSELTVINGIDMQTNGHDSGSRHFWSGRLVEGTPSFAALTAAIYGRELPMSYLSFGGYDLTAGLVARTRSGNVNALARIAYPDRYDTSDELATFHSPKAKELIQAARSQREDAMLERSTLHRVRNSMGLLFAARTGANELKKLQEFLPDELADDDMQRQAQVALAAYRAGISVAVNIHRGGFDTHGNHDESHVDRLSQLLQGVDFLMEEADAQGVRDKVVVIMGSDFGRTPSYNENAGKDHWSITSLMAMGMGISGNRVIGATDDSYQPRTVDPGNLEVDDGGIRIEPEHIHRELRKLAGIDGTDLDALFPMTPNEDLDGLFG